MPRDSKSHARFKSTVVSRQTQAEMVIDLIETGTLPMFLRMALSDALYEASLIKDIRIFKKLPDSKDLSNQYEHDAENIARLFARAPGDERTAFRVLHSTAREVEMSGEDIHEATWGGNVIDFDCWRQSHPRPIRACIVEA